MDRDATMKNRVCRSVNDPHITTFDGKHYDFMEVGEFIMYRNDNGPYWVGLYIIIEHKHNSLFFRTKHLHTDLSGFINCSFFLSFSNISISMLNGIICCVWLLIQSQIFSIAEQCLLFKLELAFVYSSLYPRPLDH